MEKTDFLLSQYHMAAFFSSYLSGNGDFIEAYESDELIKSAVKTIPALASIFALGDLMELAEPRYSSVYFSYFKYNLNIII